MRLSAGALPLLVGCAPTVTGSVTSDRGAVAGAVVRSVEGPALDAVTGGDGVFTVRVEPGTRRVRVTHPDVLPAEVDLVVEGHGEVRVPPIDVVRIPLEPGVHLLLGDHFSALAPGPLARRGSTTEGWRWCVDAAAGAPIAVPAGRLRLLDNHEADWRLFRLDADGCAYTLSPTPGGFFDKKADRVDVNRVEAYAPGRDWLEVELNPGDYLVADWFQNGFVPEGEGWRGSWLRASTPGPVTEPAEASAQ